MTRQGDLAGIWPVGAKVIHLTNADGLIDPFAQLIKELTLSQDFLDIGLRLVVDRLLLELTRRLQQRTNNRAVGIHPAVQEVKTIIDRHYSRSLPLRALADTVGLAPNYLAGLFSAQLARSPHQYQTEQRLDRAKQLLTTSDLSITAIAAEVGFSSGQHFARTFKLTTRCDPSCFPRAPLTGPGCARWVVVILVPLTEGRSPSPSAASPGSEATRYEKRSYMYLGAIAVTSIWIWLRNPTASTWSDTP